MADNIHETDKDYSYSSKLYFVIIFLLLHKENKPFSSESLFSDHPLLNELIQNDFFFFLNLRPERKHCLKSYDEPLEEELLDSKGKVSVYWKSVALSHSDLVKQLLSSIYFL